MKIIHEGKEVKCHNFADLKPGDVFAIKSVCGAFLKAVNGQMVSLCNGSIEAYANQPIVPYPNAKLDLEPVS